MFLTVDALLELEGKTVKIRPLTHRAKNRVAEHSPFFTVRKVHFMVEGLWSKVDLQLTSGDWFGRFELGEEIEVMEVIENVD